MKPYGIPRYADVECPDLVDIRRYGLKSSISRCIGKGGDIKNSFRSSKLKRQTRRLWKRIDRKLGKQQSIGYIND